jgi:hypothetical protein
LAFERDEWVKPYINLRIVIVSKPRLKRGSIKFLYEKEGD